MPTDIRVDDYIAGAPAFSKPILNYLRGLVHKGCPEVEETIKWSRPAFLFRKKILFHMSYFKAHCGFGFWHPDMVKVLADKGISGDDAAGSIGRITQLGDLPSKRDLLEFISEAQRLMSETPKPVRPARKSGAPRAEAPVPADLASALAGNKKAAAVFHSFSPSNRREYVDWIVEARREETRQKRVATAVQWLAEGKSRNWKYANC